jgi:hypothetical protein
VQVIFRFALVAVIISGTILPTEAKKKPSRARAANKADIEAAARLQVFLDRANFSPGGINGRYNDFTRKALAFYRVSQGQTAQIPPAQTNANQILRRTSAVSIWTAWGRCSSRIPSLKSTSRASAHFPTNYLHNQD